MNIDLVGLLFVFTVLGLKHGLDADHLAAIDGMTRFNAALRPRLARCTGLLFSLGHGAMVLLVVLGVGEIAQWRAPAALVSVGAWISIVLLALLGVFNLRAARSPGPAPVTVVGWRSALFGPLLRARGPWAMAGVGAFFAVSFDTFGLGALMAATGARAGGLALALSLLTVFLLGMVLVDGLNSWWITRLLRRSDRAGAIAARTMTFAIGLLSLAVAVLGTVAQLSPAVADLIEGRAPALGVGLVALALLAFGVGLLRAHRLSRSPGMEVVR